MTDRIRRGDVVDVAVELLGAGGLHALAMRRIAGQLGVQQSALYWHFENKQELLAAVANQILSPVKIPDSQDWSARIAQFATRMRDELLLYPDGAELVATAFAFRLGARRPFEQFTAELSRAGLGPDDAETGATVLLHFVLGYVTDEQQNRQAAALGAIEGDSGDDRSEQHLTERFARGIHVIIAGLQLQLPNP